MLLHWHSFSVPSCLPVACYLCFWPAASLWVCLFGLNTTRTLPLQELNNLSHNTATAFCLHCTSPPGSGYDFLHWQCSGGDTKSKFKVEAVPKNTLLHLIDCYALIISLTITNYAAKWATYKCKNKFSMTCRHAPIHASIRPSILGCSSAVIAAQGGSAWGFCFLWLG